MHLTPYASPVYLPGILEAKSMDSDLNLAFNLGVDAEAKPEDSLEVVTEGYLHTKVLEMADSEPIDAKKVLNCLTA